MPRAWVFDLDGTLVDSFSVYFDALSEIFREHGGEFTPDLRIASLTEHPPDFLESRLGPKARTAGLEKLRQRSKDDAQLVRPFEGLAPLVARLRNKGDRIAVWTNRDLVSAELILEHTGLGRYVETCVSGTCVEKRKPYTEGLSRILRFFDCKANSITMVGDHEHDMMAAKSGGALAVRASWHGYWPVARCALADHQFHDIQSFSKFVCSETPNR